MTAEPMFVPRPGQVDYTHVRYAPVLNAVVVYRGRVLLLQRSSGMRSYPNHWCGISGHRRYRLDRESQAAGWFSMAEAMTLPLLPGFEAVVAQYRHIIDRD
jgi:hypothetical protein